MHTRLIAYRPFATRLNPMNPQRGFGLLLAFITLLASTATSAQSGGPGSGSARTVTREATGATSDIEATVGYQGFGYFALLAKGWSHGPSVQAAWTPRWPQDPSTSRGIRLTIRYTQLVDGYGDGCALGCTAYELDRGFNIGGSIGYFRLKGRWWYSIGLGVVGEVADVHQTWGPESLGDGAGNHVLPELALAAGYRIPLSSGLFFQASLDVGTLLVTWSGVLGLGLGYSL